MTPNSAEGIRVLIVDPDHRVRQSLSGLICCLGDRVEVVGTAAHAGEALGLVERERPDVVLIDPRLPEVDAGLAFVALLHVRHPQTRVVVMGWSESLEHPAFANGATAFIGKGDSPNAFLDAIVAGTPPAA